MVGCHFATTACSWSYTLYSKMEIKMGVCFFILWLVTLTATAQEYKTCGEIAAANQQQPYEVKLIGTTYKVQCDMSVKPVTTTIKVKDMKLEANSFYNINYETVPKEAIKELVDVSENCKQSVKYDCKHSAEFTKGSWFTVDGKGISDWGSCDAECKCSLNKESGIPISIVSLQSSNITITVSDMICYGGIKGAVTFNNRGSFSSVNLTSSVEIVKFKFKSSANNNKNKTIAVVHFKDGGYIKVGVDKNDKLAIKFKTKEEKTQSFIDVDKEWHAVRIDMGNNKIDGKIDGVSAMETLHDSVPVKVVFGEKSCLTFIGCVKDLYIGEKDSTQKLLSSPDKISVVEGCEDDVQGGCVIPKNKDSDDDSDDDDDDDDDDNSTAVIVIVVVLLLLLILLLVAFFITWYLKRNKGVYQTHEGSAEDIHGDTDNLTLVTKPTEQDPEGQKSKEYYL